MEELKSRHAVLEKDVEKVLENGLEKLSVKGWEAPAMRKPELLQKTSLLRQRKRLPQPLNWRRPPAVSVPLFTIRINVSDAAAALLSASVMSFIPPGKGSTR